MAGGTGDEQPGVDLGLDRAFVFTNEQTGHATAASLREFAAAVASRPAHQLDRFLRHGDFSKWISDVFGDNTLAADVRTIENQYRLGRVSDVADAIVHSVETRYDLAAP